MGGACLPRAPPLAARRHVTRRRLPARWTLEAKMAAELVEAKVSERRRCQRLGEAGPGGSGLRALRRPLPARSRRRAVRFCG